MKIAVAIVLTILKVTGILLLFALALVIVLLLLPVGIQLEYAAKTLQVEAKAGPVKIQLWPRPEKKKPARSQVKETTASPPPARKPEAVKKKVPPPTPPQEKPPKMGEGFAPQPETKKEPFQALPSFLRRRLERAMQLLKADPIALVEDLLGHAGWLVRRLLKSIKICHLQVYWTIHREDAASTAVTYGAVMASLNNLLARLRLVMKIQSDSLRLDPDFTGDGAGERRIACQIFTRPCILLFVFLWLLWRVWFDPLLQPVSSK